MPDATVDQQVLITRIFDAPRARVFKAWTDPDDVAAWYGPEHSDTPREFDPHRSARRRPLRAHDGPARQWRNVRARLRDHRADRARTDRLFCVRTRCPRSACTRPTITRIELFDHGNKTRMTLTDGPYARGAGHAEAAGAPPSSRRSRSS